MRTVLNGHSQHTMKVCVSPDGKRLATTSIDETVRVWDPETGHELARQNGIVGMAGLAFSTDSRVLAFSVGSELRLWDVEATEVRKISTPHLGPITSLSFSPDQQSLASGGDDGVVRLWEPRSGRALPAQDQPRGETLAVESARPELVRLDGVTEFPFCIAISPDGHSIAAGGNKGSAEVWDTTTGTVLLRLPRRTIPYSDLLYFSDGRTLAAAIANAFMPLYDTITRDGKLVLKDPSNPERPAWSLALTPDERLVIGAIGVQGEPGTATIWDASTGQLRAVLRGHSDYVRAVAVSCDGQILVTGSGDETIKLWDLASRSELVTLAGHQGQVFCLAVEPNGRLLASGSEDHTIRLWDIENQKHVATLEGHTGAVHSVAFSPDGTRLASASRDGAVFLWHVSTRRKVGSLIGHTKRVNQVKFFPDGKTLVSASADGTIRFWYSDPVQR